MERRSDRQVIAKYMNFYCEEIGLENSIVSYPEDNPSTPVDARIDAIYRFEKIEIHVEHTSIDLIVSGKRNKRSLDPAFSMINNAIIQSNVNAKQGICFDIPFEVGKNIKKLRESLPELIKQIKLYTQYIENEEWNKYPRVPDTLSIQDIEFRISPDPLKGGTFVLSWMGSKANFLESNELETRITSQVKEKLSKLSISVNSDPLRVGILLVENTDIAAKDFYSHAGVFARIIDESEMKCNEIWGIRCNNTPVLLWCDLFDLGIKYCVYTEDPQSRWLEQILKQRSSDWKKLRQSWLSNYL